MGVSTHRIDRIAKAGYDALAWHHPSDYEPYECLTDTVKQHWRDVALAITQASHNEKIALEREILNGTRYAWA